MFIYIYIYHIGKCKVRKENNDNILSWTDKLLVLYCFGWWAMNRVLICRITNCCVTNVLVSGRTECISLKNITRQMTISTEEELQIGWTLYKAWHKLYISICISKLIWHAKQCSTWFFVFREVDIFKQRCKSQQKENKDLSEKYVVKRNWHH